MTPRSIDEVVALPAFSEKIKACEKALNTRYSEVDHSVQDALTLRRFQQMVKVQAVAALPSVIGEAAPVPAAPATDGNGAVGVLGKVKGILERMTATDWEQGRSEALAILATPPGLVNGATRQAN